MTAIIVAKIDRDHDFEEMGDNSLIPSRVGKEFDYEALENWWGWGRTNDDGVLPEDELQQLPHTRFKLYDDDGNLYYEGWLYNDPQCLVQQFVLAWAESDVGCTTIKVRKLDLTWEQQIG